MWVIHDYTLIANAAYVKGRATITYEEIRDFYKILGKKLVENNIPFMYESEDENVFEVFGHTFIRTHDEVMLVNVMDEKFMESVNCYDDEIKKIIEDSRNEYFLDHTIQGKKIKEIILRRGGQDEIQLSN